MDTTRILLILVEFHSAGFWSSWWLEILITVAILLAAILFHRSKIKKLNNKLADLERQLLERSELLSHSKQKEQNARDEAAQESRNKSVLLSKISHDIRTPMTTMMGMASLLNETSLTAEQQEYSNTISDSGESLLKLINDILINDILEYSRFESGKELEQQDFDLRTIIEEVLAIFASKAALQNVELVYNIDDRVPTQLAGDTMRIQQILNNLIKNAIRYTPNGEVYIGVNLLQTAQNDTVNLQFEVRDTGLGMNRNKFEQISKGFAEPVSNLNTNGITSGVGLIICKNLIALMGGNISLESQENHGSTFRFNIWLRISPQISRTNRLSEMQLDGKKVLVVDDNVTLSNLLLKQLTKWNVFATAAFSGEAALDLLAQNVDFDLLIVDLKMPGMNGIELSQGVKSLYPNLPIILMNQFGDETYKKHLSIFGSVIEKPIRQHVLAEQFLTNLRKNKTTIDVANKQKLSVEFAKENPLRILLAEDDVMNQKMVIKVLNKLGYKPHVSNNGNEVLEEVSLNNYDLILMDVQMPEMDGLEATKMIRLCLDTQPTIIAMTANTLQGDRDLCMRAGMDDYVSKPVKIEELVNVLAKWALFKQPQ